MKTLFRFGLVVALGGLLEVTPALAVSLGFVPASQTAGVGESVSVDVVVSDLGAGSAPSLGAFDLDVSFDPLILAPTSVTFGPFLGDEGLVEALTSFTLLPGVVDLAEVSFLLPAELDALQPASFTLATLFFDTLGVGTSPLTFAQALLDDAFAVRLDLAPDTGSVTVVATAPVPFPGTLLLVGSGLVALALRWGGGRAARGGANQERADLVAFLNAL
ncbi:MAG: hypothetical protein ACREM3_22815 [Candidatus Rokuibacteriota bacterium]